MREDFRRVFGMEPELSGRAPGRVNLIGEHTDYNEGFVLPIALRQETVVQLRRRDDLRVRVWTAARPGDPPAIYELGDEQPSSEWLAYVQGTTALLRARGHAVSGVDLSIWSSVPVGAGVSSSASLLVALLRALRSAFAFRLDDIELARLAQGVENEFVGARVGIMDPMAVSLAGSRAALFLDCRDLSHELLPLPAGWEVLVVHSGITHRHAGGEYNRRRQECEEAATRLGVRSLREVGPSAAGLTQGSKGAPGALPDPLARRARHVVSENARVLEAVRALRQADKSEMGRLLAASHASLSEDFEVSTPELDLLVACLSRQAGVMGARLTGGGFGGSVVALAGQASAAEAASQGAREYQEATGRLPVVIAPWGSRQPAV